MFIEKQRVYNYMTPQQLRQFEAINPDCFKTAYNDAIGYIIPEIGHIWDMDSLLSAEGDDRNVTLLWMITVMTAYNICAPSLAISEPLSDQYAKVTRKIYELKSSQITLSDADRAGQPNALGELVSNKCNYLG